MEFQLMSEAIGHLTSAVQFGFILGTLTFAILTIADRFSPSKVFFISAVLGASINLFTLFPQNNLITLLIIRLGTGFFLAGIYPIGMKIAADYFKEGLGKSLGYLVGALVLGTALPHLLKAFSINYDWRLVIFLTSALAFFGGIIVFFFVPNGPFRKPAASFKLRGFYQVFTNRKFRSAAFGYFGHMWELYAFWAFVPFIVTKFLNQDYIYDSLIAFIIIAVGGPACVLGGYLSQKFGPARTASAALLCSGLCCLLSPLAFYFFSYEAMIIFLLIWGITVIADSPLFSTLVANNAEPQIKGTALTIVNCLGFSITIVSIQILNSAQAWIPAHLLFLLLLPGPIAGLIAIKPYRVN